MRVLILGATSAIAHETAKCFAADGAELFLVGRSTDKLATIQDDLKVRGAKNPQIYEVDLSLLEHHQGVIDAAVQALGGLDAVLIAYGTLGDQKQSEASVEDMLREFNTNGVSVLSLLTILGNYFEKQGKGCIAVISSVAGERGRGSNYVYGTAKGAVSLFTQGLRQRLGKTGVAVVTIKPGFVDTPMTASLRKNPLYANASSVGARVYRAMLKGEDIVYVPWFWRYIMMAIRNIPESVFKKMSVG